MMILNIETGTQYVCLEDPDIFVKSLTAMAWNQQVRYKANFSRLDRIDNAVERMDFVHTANILRKKF